MPIKNEIFFGQAQNAILAEAKGIGFYPIRPKLGITMVYGHPNCPCLICLCMSFSHAYQGMSNAYHMLTSSDELNLPGLMVSIISIGFLIYTNIFLSSIGLCLKCLWVSKVKCYYYAVFTPSLPPSIFFYCILVQQTSHRSDILANSNVPQNLLFQNPSR